jgi:hypothetical protein
VEHQRTHRVRRVAAVVDQVVVRLVLGLALVAPVRVDQQHELLARERAEREGVLEPQEDGLRRPARIRTVELLLGVVEQREAVARCGIAELVDEPGEAVDRREAHTVALAEDERRHGEVLVLRAPVDLADPGECADRGGACARGGRHHSPMT